MFSSLRSGKLELINKTGDIYSNEDNDHTFTQFKPRTMIMGSSKNMRIENNTLTIGSSRAENSVPENQFKVNRCLKIKNKLPSNTGQISLNSFSEVSRSNLVNHNNDISDIQQRNRTYQVELGFHEFRFSEEYVMVDLLYFPGAREGDLAELKTYCGSPTTKDKKIYFMVKKLNGETRRRSKHAQISILSGHLQRLLDLPTRSKVWIKLKSKYSNEADLVELNIKDCYVNRGDMWCFSGQLVDSCVFLDQRITFLDSLRTVVKGIYRDGRKVLSGYIGTNTRIIYRSESARLVFLIQITDEMWNFEENGEKMFHKVVNSLFPKIFKKWKKIGTRHTITIVLCSSIDYSDEPYGSLKPGQRLKNTKDYFRIVVDQVNIVHWSDIMKTLRREFMLIEDDLKNVKMEDGNSAIKGRFVPIIKSNILEAINFVTTIIANPFNQPYLRHTTTHAILVSPGSGLYDVDFDLLKITSKKLLSLEMTIDLICLTRAPLHFVPLFRYIDYENKLHHCAPTWLSISFWNDTSNSTTEWQPRCKFYNIQMMGLADNDIREDIALEYLNTEPEIRTINKAIEKYDHDVFTDLKIWKLKNNKYSDYSEIMKDEEIILKKKRQYSTKSSFTWQTPSSSNALVQPAFTQEIFADLSTQRNNTNVFDTEYNYDTSSPIYSIENQTSLAADTLKNASRSRGMTHTLVSKIFPDLQLKTKKSFTSIMRKNMDSNNDYVFVRKEDPSFSTEDNPTLLENSMVNKELRHKDVKVSFEHGDELCDVRSSKNVHHLDKRPLILDSLYQKSARTGLKYNYNLLNDTCIEILNPSTPVSAKMAGLLIPRRWKNVFPKYVVKKYSKWRSFTMPAELPITTTMFPSKEDFEVNFIFSNHSVTLNVDHELYGQTNYDLLKNMIYVRLLTGFQICIGDRVRKVESLKSKDSDSSLITKYLTKENYMHAKIYMMIGNEIHRIACGYDGAIDIQRYIRKENVNIMHSIASYSPHVKTRYETLYRESSIDPIKIWRESFNWNQIDQILGGYNDSVMEANKKMYRSKFVVLPAEIPINTYITTVNGAKDTLSAEEIRLEGLRKLVSLIEKSRLRTDEEKMSANSGKEEILPELLFYTGSLYEYINEQKENLQNLGNNAKDSIFIGNGFTKDITLQKLAYEMQQGDNNLNLVNRKWHWKRHEYCFIGLELINWLIENFSDIDTRDEALKYGQLLMDEGLFHHVENRHVFLDGHYFYQIAPDFIVSSKYLHKHKSTGNIQASQRTVSVDSKTDLNKHVKPISISNMETTQSKCQDSICVIETQQPRISVLLSSALTIDLDPSHSSSKLEACTVHYDRVHNPDHCFHIRLEWLTTTPKLVDDLINNWTRLCERFGLKLVEVPWNELCSLPETNPFHSFVTVKLAIDPWVTPEFHDPDLFSYQKFYYHIFLLEFSGFLLDNRASKIFQNQDLNYDIIYSWGKPVFKFPQYIHSTGAYIAEVCDNGDIMLAPNNIYLSRVNVGDIAGKIRASSKLTLDFHKVIIKFKKVCLDYKKLREIFIRGKEQWLKDRQNMEEYNTAYSNIMNT